MSYLLLVIAVFSGLLVGGGMVAMLYERRALLKRIEQLEQASKKRLPYQTAEELEHSLSALIVLKDELDFKVSLVDNAMAHLQKARGGEK